MGNEPDEKEEERDPDISPDQPGPFRKRREKDVGRQVREAQVDMGDLLSTNVHIRRSRQKRME